MAPIYRIPLCLRRMDKRESSSSPNVMQLLCHRLTVAVINAERSSMKGGEFVGRITRGRTAILQNLVTSKYSRSAFRF